MSPAEPVLHISELGRLLFSGGRVVYPGIPIILTEINQYQPPRVEMSSDYIHVNRKQKVEPSEEEVEV